MGAYLDKIDVCEALAHVVAAVCPAEPSFLLHWRDPAKVAISGGTYGVIPTGEFQRLQAARADGSLRAFVLGLGVDALTLSTNVLTVVVIDDEVFTEVFGSAVRCNEEGEIVTVGGGTPTGGVPFTEAKVRRMLESEPMAETGAACLALAWQHRETLGL